MTQPSGAPTSNHKVNQTGLQKGTGVRVFGRQRPMQSVDYKLSDNFLDLACRER